ncbi:CBU_1387 family Dot/Icm T4SS effector [Coxiella burnetii]|uniref:CBU_1387 family Dot/Icm T4SS effector n=1 Tax=Coxiella burnetii TaxID=777 RepID=UPI0000DAEA2F|nr:CBU_1387 family Dot/Icm T4SS effector [Coxiella burnetii]ABX77634.1 hypothetical protein COXBURSA331_A1546 [Coxiella burnetii RSA 331]ATN82435.1 hypothetical protein AYO24_07245 [Coxiella burnetii]ATN84337.1 hypothetical protein AYO23_07260 [Coxiella burnetii]POZ77506.1 hypothetical protein CbuRSA461_07490 [Coxiella burnetii]
MPNKEPESIRHCIEELIREYRSGSRFFTIGMKRKAAKIQEALINTLKENSVGGSERENEKLISQICNLRSNLRKAIEHQRRPLFEDKACKIATSVQVTTAEMSQSMRKLCNILMKEGYIQETEEKKVEETGSEVIERGLFQYRIKSLRKLEGVAYTSTHSAFRLTTAGYVNFAGYTRTQLTQFPTPPFIFEESSDEDPFLRRLTPRMTTPTRLTPK